MAKAEDLTITYEENGIELVKEIDKVILAKGAWATILFMYKDWDKKTEQYGDTKFTIRRYQKSNDEYYSKSKFNISSVKQAAKIVEALQGWIEKENG